MGLSYLVFEIMTTSRTTDRLTSATNAYTWDGAAVYEYVNWSTGIQGGSRERQCLAASLILISRLSSSLKNLTAWLIFEGCVSLCPSLESSLMGCALLGPSVKPPLRGCAFLGPRLKPPLRGCALLGPSVEPPLRGWFSSAPA